MRRIETSRTLRALVEGDVHGARGGGVVLNGHVGPSATRTCLPERAAQSTPVASDCGTTSKSISASCTASSKDSSVT